MKNKIKKTTIMMMMVMFGVSIGIVFGIPTNVQAQDGTKIAFISTRDGNAEIYVMDANGSNQTRLTNNLNQDSQPSFSPDGTKITFTSFRDGNFEIYVMDADGSNQTRLTNDPAIDTDPSFSPEGTKIAFRRNA
jgi:TolB protein